MTENQPQEPTQQPAQPQQAPQPAQPQMPPIPQPQQPTQPQMSPQSNGFMPQQDSTQPQNPCGNVPPQGFQGYQQPPMANPAAPSPTAALICGIGSIVGALLCAPLGLAAGIVAIVLVSKHIKRHGKDSTANAAKICGIVGTVLSAIFTVFSVLALTALLTFVDSGMYEDFEQDLLEDGYEYEYDYDDYGDYDFDYEDYEDYGEDFDFEI